MKPSPLLSLMLAALTALWTPAWCCCARMAEDQAVSRGADDCPRCHASDAGDSDSPAEPAPATCPHAAARSLATIQPTPRFEPPALILIALLDHACVTLAPPASAPTSRLAFDLAPPPQRSLLALACMYLI